MPKSIEKAKNGTDKQSNGKAGLGTDKQSNSNGKVMEKVVRNYSLLFY